MWFTILLASFCVILFLFKIRSKPKSNIWEENGMPFIDISKLASTLELMLGLKDEFDLDKKLYSQISNGKFTGFIEAHTPLLMVKDLDLVKNVLIKDFEYFVDRRNFFAGSTSELILNTLPALEGKAWRNVRLSATPTFTTGKLRRLMGLFNDCGKEWISILKKESGTAIDIKEHGYKFTLDVIGATVFGMKVGSQSKENSDFANYANGFADSSKIQVIKQSLALRFPNIFKLLGFENFNDGMLNFYDKLLGEELKKRENAKEVDMDVRGHADFLQLLVEARNGKLKALGSDELDSFENDAKLADVSSSKQKYVMDEVAMKSLGFIFIFAGYQGLCLAISYAVNALATHPKVQDKLRDEVDEKFEKDGSIDYDDVNSLTYLEMFVSEIMRFYPITPRLDRVCGKDYVKPEIGLRIPKGVTVVVPISAIHMDPKYYPNPETFDPEHFSVENKAKRHYYSYMPFGHGPRSCIGMRFALMELKTCIAHLVHNFEIEPTKNTQFPVKTQLVGQGTAIPGRVEVKLSTRSRK